MTLPTRLSRDVPEKAEAFLREALLAASYELRPFVAMMRWLAAPDQRKASFFQTHHGTGMDFWRVIACYRFHSCLRNKYAGDLPLLLQMISKRVQRRAHKLDPLRDGSEKDDFFLHRARPAKHGLLQIIAAYETMHSALIRKKIDFFGHVTEQASG